MKILIIEDKKMIADMYKTQFESMGHEVTIAANGAEGLAYLDMKKPDLVLLDVMMPIMGGFEVLEKMKGHPARNNFKVFVLSNLSQEAEVKKGLELGADDFLVKSNFTPAELGDKIGLTDNSKKV